MTCVFADSSREPALERAMPGDAVTGSTIPEDSEAEILLRDGTWVWAQVIGQRRDRHGRWCVGVRWYASPTVGCREGWYLYDPRLIRRPPLTLTAAEAARLRRPGAQIAAVPWRPVVLSPAVLSPAVLGATVLSVTVLSVTVLRPAVLRRPVPRTDVARHPVAGRAVAGQAQAGQIRKIASRGVPGLLLEQMPGPELLDQPVKNRPHRATLPPSRREIQAMTDLGEPG
jgi:hypothetical protein